MSLEYLLLITKKYFWLGQVGALLEYSLDIPYEDKEVCGDGNYIQKKYYNTLKPHIIPMASYNSAFKCF